MIRRAFFRSGYGDILLFSILAICWGTSFVAIEIGLEYVPPLLFAGLRYGVAGLIVFGYAAVVTDRLRPVDRTEWLSVGVAGLFLIAFYHALLYVGELYVSGAIAATVASTAPILTAAFAGAILPRERLSSAGVVGLVLGLIGVVAVVRPSPAGLDTELLLGAGLVFGAAIAFAVGTVLARPLDAGLPLETLQAWAMLVGAAVLLVGAPLRGESVAAIDVTPTALLSFTYLTLVSSVFAFLLYFQLLDRAGPTQVALVGYAEPAVAIGVSWVLLGYVVDSLTVLGLVTILAGFAVIKRRRLARVLERRPEVLRRPVTGIRTLRNPTETRRSSPAEARTDGGVPRDTEPVSPESRAD
ncbi:DMT family transporter [Natronococcus sp. A-GB1]|uniref:DMT family transporter n=1 Tax=Natronococcus sp. A-GB1 TaxID=3037648 RepID=UPI00241C3FA6|nr:DMT family transporter [Natronococcus sp. A-GB1]MDG5759355.1 DMT family transporter [Natronococcus sp. A-GB1]